MENRDRGSVSRIVRLEACRLAGHWSESPHKCNMDIRTQVGIWNLSKCCQAAEHRVRDVGQGMPLLLLITKTQCSRRERGCLVLSHLGSFSEDKCCERDEKTEVQHPNLGRPISPYRALCLQTASLFPLAFHGTSASIICIMPLYLRPFTVTT